MSEKDLDLNSAKRAPKGSPAGRGASENIRAVMLGHAVGDALGVPVEFASREELDANPVTDMAGFGTYPVPKGAWSDDTSMSLCALDALADGRPDFDKVMQNFCKWYYDDEFTPTEEMFDVGNACSTAIENYTFCENYEKCGLTSETSNGNGSLMRIHPFVLYAEYAGYTEDWLDTVHTASALTHAHKRSQIGCGIYAFVLRELLNDPSKDAAVSGLAKAKARYSGEPEAEYYGRLFAPDFALTDRSGIKSSGYVVDTLEAAVWCLLTSDGYEECVLKAVNLGDDTDTVAAVAGGLAGALWGLDSIPKPWLDALLKRDYLEELCEKAERAWGKDRERY